MAQVKKQKSPQRYFDTSALTGLSRPASLATIIRENGGVRSMDAHELRQLRSCAVGEVVNMGIGGGFVPLRRVAAPRRAPKRTRKSPPAHWMGNYRACGFCQTKGCERCGYEGWISK